MSIQICKSKTERKWPTNIDAPGFKDKKSSCWSIFIQMEVPPSLYKTKKFQNFNCNCSELNPCAPWKTLEKAVAKNGCLIIFSEDSLQATSNLLHSLNSWSELPLILQLMWMRSHLFIYSFHNSCFFSDIFKNKAGYWATQVASRWAGAVI